MGRWGSLIDVVRCARIFNEIRAHCYPGRKALMSYDRFKPLRQQLQQAINTAQTIPDVYPGRSSKAAIQQSVPQRFALTPPGTRLTREPLYRAERRIYFLYVDNPNMQWLFSLEEVEQYVEQIKINYRNAFSRISWPLSFQMTKELGAWYLAGVMTVPIPVQRMAILHELAHHFIGVEAGHTKTFLEAYMTLVRLEIGDEVAARFMKEMDRS